MIELPQILIEDCVKVLATRVYIRFFLGSLHLGLFNHFLVSKYQSVGLIGATIPKPATFVRQLWGIKSSCHSQGSLASTYRSQRTKEQGCHCQNRSMRQRSAAPQSC